MNKDKVYRKILKEMERSGDRCHVVAKRLFPSMYDKLKTKHRRKYVVTGKILHDYLRPNPRCGTCGKEMPVSGFREKKQYCSQKCVQNSPLVMAKKKATNLERRGVEWPTQCQSVRTKVVKTLRRNYGVSAPAQSKIVQRRMRATTLERYGVENASQADEVKKKKYATTLAKTGNKYWVPFQDPAVIAKIRKTMVERYGHESTMQSERLRKKAESTNLKRYGARNVFGSATIRREFTKRHLEKYGVEHPMQRPEIFRQAQLSLLRSYEFVYKNKKFTVQGYEDIMIRLLTGTMGVPITNISANCKPIHYKFKRKSRCYIPDLRITGPNRKMYVEVKSTYTAGLDKSNKLDSEVLKKAKSVGAAGYPILLCVLVPHRGTGGKGERKGYIKHFLLSTPERPDWKLYQNKRSIKTLVEKFHNVQWNS